MAARREMGRLLARRHPVEADLVVPVPDSGVSAALGYAEASGHPLRLRPHPQPLRGPHLHRAQAEHPQLRREGEAEPRAGTCWRASAWCWWTTASCAAPPARRSCRWCGRPAPKEVHLRIACPPTTHSCFYGIDTPKRKHLIASYMPVEEIRAFVEADTLGYLAMEDLQDGLQRRWPGLLLRLLHRRLPSAPRDDLGLRGPGCSASYPGS